MPSIRHLTRRALIGLALGTGASGAFAQTWPDRPLTLIVPWGAGGGTDAVARMERRGFPVAPSILGVVLGTMVEEHFFSSLIKPTATSSSSSSGRSPVPWAR